MIWKHNIHVIHAPAQQKNTSPDTSVKRNFLFFSSSFFYLHFFRSLLTHCSIFHHCRDCFIQMCFLLAALLDRCCPPIRRFSCHLHNLCVFCYESMHSRLLLFCFPFDCKDTSGENGKRKKTMDSQSHRIEFGIIRLGWLLLCSNVWKYQKKIYSCILILFWVFVNWTSSTVSDVKFYLRVVLFSSRREKKNMILNGIRKKIWEKFFLTHSKWTKYIYFKIFCSDLIWFVLSLNV